MNSRPTTYKDAALTGLSYAPIITARSNFYAFGNPIYDRLVSRCWLHKICNGFKRTFTPTISDSLTVS